MADDGFTCRECGQSWDNYHDAPKALDPRVKRSRVICRGCVSKIRATQAGGPYNGHIGSKGGGASSDMADQWSGKVGQLRKRVYDWLRTHEAAGAEDIARALDEDPDNVSPRISELKAMGLVRKGPRTAVTRRGNPAHKYEAAA